MGFISKIASILLTFIGRRIFLQILALEYLGINSLFADVLSLLTMADLGLATAMAYSFYKPLAEKDEYKLAALIGFYRKIYNIIAVVVAVIGIALVPFLKYFVRLDNDIPYLEVYYLVALANTVISYMFVYKASIITADQKAYLVSQYALWTNILKTVLQIAVLYVTKNYLVYCSMTIVATLLNNLIVSYQANKYYPFIRQKAVLDPNEKRNIFQTIKSAFLYKAVNSINTGTTNILISVIVGTVAVGLYANYNVAVSTLIQLSVMFFGSLTASLGNLVVRENAKKRLQVFKTMQTASYWMSGFLIFCLYFVMDDFIVLWLGEQYVLGTLTKIMVLMNLYLVMTVMPVLSFREAVGMFQKIKYIMLITVVLNIALSFILGRYWGIAGILMASFIAKVCTYVWYEPWILFRDFFESKVRRLFWNHFANLALVSVCIAVFHAILPVYKTADWFEWLVKGCIFSIIINIVYFIRYRRSEEYQILKEKVVGILAGGRKK